MNVNLYPKTAKYTWSICAVLFGMAGSLGVSAAAGYFVPELWWPPLVGIVCVSIFAVVCARQAYVYKRKWPQSAIFCLSPSALFTLALSPNPYVSVSVTAFNLLLWLLALQFTKRLVAISPYPAG